MTLEPLTNLLKYPSRSDQDELNEEYHRVLEELAHLKDVPIAALQESPKRAPRTLYKDVAQFDSSEL